MLDTLREISIKVPLEQEGDKIEEQPIPLERVLLTANSQERVKESDAVITEMGPVIAEEAVPSPLGPTVSFGRRSEGSENGTETEEDEGMVLVGRPES